MDVLKVVMESPALQALVINAIGQTIKKALESLNSNRPTDQIKMWLHPLYLLLAGAAFLVDGYEKGSLSSVDPAQVQNFLNIYANTLLIHFGGGAIKNKLTPVAAKPAEPTDNATK